MDIPDQILMAFYEEHKYPSSIAKELKVSTSYVTKTIQKDDRYISEKESRAKISKEKRKVYQSNWSKSKRKSDQELNDIVKKQHIEASIELSVPILN